MRIDPRIVNLIIALGLIASLFTGAAPAFADEQIYVDGILFTGVEPHNFVVGTGEDRGSACPWDADSAKFVFKVTQSDGKVIEPTRIDIVEEHDQAGKPTGQAYQVEFAQDMPNYVVKFGVMQSGDAWYSQQQVIPTFRSGTWRCLTNAEALRRGIPLSDQSQKPEVSPPASEPKPEVSPPGDPNFNPVSRDELRTWLVNGGDLQVENGQIAGSRGILMVDLSTSDLRIDAIHLNGSTVQSAPAGSTVTVWIKPPFRTAAP